MSLKDFKDPIIEKVTNAFFTLEIHDPNTSSSAAKAQYHRLVREHGPSDRRYPAWTEALEVLRQWFDCMAAEPDVRRAANAPEQAARQARDVAARNEQEARANDTRARWNRSYLPVSDDRRAPRASDGLYGRAEETHHAPRTRETHFRGHDANLPAGGDRRRGEQRSTQHNQGHQLSDDHAYMDGYQGHQSGGSSQFQGQCQQSRRPDGRQGDQSSSYDRPRFYPGG